MACVKLKVTSSDPATLVADGIVVLLFSGKGRLPHQVAALDEHLGGSIARARRSGDFKGEDGETLTLYRAEGVKATRVILHGLGDAKEKNAEELRRIGFSLARSLASLRVGKPVVLAAIQKSEALTEVDQTLLVAEGMALAVYEGPQWKKEKDATAKSKRIREITLPVGTAREARAATDRIKRLTVIVDAVLDARDLGNTPANHMTPSDLATYARKVARETRSKVTVLGVPEMKRLKMGAILGVAQGSRQPPRTIVLEHSPRGAKKTLCFVGKGVTFDSGGISLKPWKPMWDMKYDMCGAAATLAAFRALARLKTRHRIVAIVGATENLPDGSAYKPGDVVVAGNGKSIEIHSTDAEGRVVLADMLHHARRFKPDAVVDLATLTGAVITALGRHCSAVMGNDEALVARLLEAGKRSGDRLWELPLWDEYASSLQSQVADVCNTGDGTGGSIQGGAFLKNFVDYPWCHVDIAGTAWLDSDTGTLPRGGTGFGVRLLVELAETWK